MGQAIQAFLKSRFFYPLVFLVCLTPAAGMGYQIYTGALGVNPVETLLHQTGRTALACLIAALAITPLRRLTGWNRVQLVRRMVGVWSAFYALCHFLIYVVFNHLGDLDAIADDVATRPFISMGMLTFAILMVLAATSTNGMMRRLGKHWQRLHRVVYVAGVTGAIHFVWGQKADIREPLIWAAAVALLLGIRIVFSLKKRRARTGALRQPVA